MMYDRGMGCVVYLYLTGFWQAGGGANGRGVTGCGLVGVQQVLEGGRYISASGGGDPCSVLGGCLIFLSLCSSGFQDLLLLKPQSLLMLLGINAPHISFPVILHPFADEDGTDSSETSAIRTQMSGNYPKNILYIEHGESLKSRIECISFH